MDKKLKEAIDKGRAVKEKKDREKQKVAEVARTAHQKLVDLQLPSARKWIQDVLFPEITKQEALGPCYRSIYLGSDYKDGILAEAIYEAAKKIKGLKPTYNCPPVYEHAEFQGPGVPIYSIGWESTDPNDNRNDR